MNILITGGTGFIGTELIKEFPDDNLIVLTRKKLDNTSVKYITSLDDIKSEDKIDIIINLAGATISQYWTSRYKQTLFVSRIYTTQSIVDLIERLDVKPKLLISASAIGYYGAQTEKLDENSKVVDDFLHQLCKSWEETALKAESFGTRVCIPRLGLVLGRNGGILKKMLLPFKLGLGGKLGSGNQYFSWIHIEDVLDIFKSFIINEQLSGVYNTTAPSCITNYEFTKALGKVLNRPTIFAVPSFVLSTFLGEMGRMLLLEGPYVHPKNLLNMDYNFQFTDIHKALEDIIQK